MICTCIWVPTSNGNSSVKTACALYMQWFWVEIYLYVIHQWSLYVTLYVIHQWRLPPHMIATEARILMMNTTSVKCISDLKYSKSEAQRLNTKETRQGTYIGSSCLNHFLTFYWLLKLKLVGQLGLVKHETLETMKHGL